ncbi:hypothetical protein PHISP_07884 [Aspergillus sp. HF37]|nr:hypothetical protein PHISP_07884 [Aspergillus sp. HF37]
MGSGQRSSSPASSIVSSTESPSTLNTAAPAPAPVSTASRTPNGLRDPRPDDDSASSDRQSVTDPFNADASSSDRDAEDEDEDGLRITAPFSTTSAPTSTASVVIAPRTDVEYEYSTDRENAEKNAPTPKTTAAKSDVLVHSLPSHPGSHTTSSSSTEVSSRTGAATERGASESDKDPRVLASRAGNKEKKPPPPPKSHHGKLISPNSVASSSPSAAANRLSFHDSSTEASLSRQPDDPSHSAKPPPSNGRGSAGSAENQPISRPESLQRSQSQHKRPPTPPLRRQSQMRRSKTTNPKTNPIGSAAARNIETNASPSFDRGSITSSRRQSGSSAPVSDEAAPRTPSSSEEPANAAASMPESQNPTQLPRMPASKSAKRASYNSFLTSSAAPPPPPPRRIRGVSNNSSASAPPESAGQPEEEFVPHPSNASDILADLSRLQKEVDDLRGHYEGRKVSQ